MKIEYINSKNIKFLDGREYEFLESNPPPSSWTKNDNYYIDERGNEKGIKRTIVINRSKKDQERVVSYLRGGISKGFAPEAKLGKDYPDEWLDKDWPIKDISLADESPYSLSSKGEPYILVADPSPYGSIWKPLTLTNEEVNRMASGQVIRISKGQSKKIKKYYSMKNLSIDMPPFAVGFEEFQKSQL